MNKKLLIVFSLFVTLSINTKLGAQTTLQTVDFE